jgi:Flp pilus assembly pilin Flp
MIVKRLAADEDGAMPLQHSVALLGLLVVAVIFTIAGVRGWIGSVQ